ncbi:MAG TPA: TolC family protein [Candidatus Hydrogenedentes bacterium]|nr:TolC family protein [Candidatus Hydrogenedentota bacterium]
MKHALIVLCLVGMGAAGAQVPASPGADATPISQEEINALLENVQEVMTGVDSYAPVELAAPQGEPVILDVHQCVDRALMENAKALAAIDDLNAKKAMIGQARSARLPQAKAQGAYTYMDGLETDFGGGLISLFMGGSSFMPKKQTWTFQATVEQVLYAGGQIQSAIRASKYLAQSEAWKRQAILDQIELDAKQAFYDCHLTQALILVAKESIVTFERHHADAQHMLEVGMVSRFEVLRAETELGARQTDLESAKTAAHIAALNLRRIMGMPQDAPLQLAGKLEWTPITEPVDAMVTAAKEKRSELKALEEGLKAADQNIYAKWGQFKPKAATTLTYTETEGGSSLNPDGLTVNVGAQIDIFTGGKRFYDLKQAKAERQSLEHQKLDVERLVELDVRQAYARVQEAIAKIRREKGTVELGREGLRLAQLRFQEGVGTQAETLDADLALTQARTTLAQALRDYEVAIASLDKAVGRSWVERDLPAPLKPTPMEKVRKIVHMK